MKIFLILTIFCVFFAKEAKSDKSIDEFFKRLIDNLKELLPKGDKKLNIPPMDPYRVKDVDETVKKENAEFTLKLKGLIVDGISKFDITKIHSSLSSDIRKLSLKIGVIFHQISIGGTYDINGKAWRFVPIYGNGSANITISKFAVDTNIDFTIDLYTGHMNISNLEILLNMGGVSFYFENFLGGGILGKLVNEIINLLGKPMFDKRKPEIEKQIREILTKFLREKLKNVDIRKIINPTTSESDKSDDDDNVLLVIPDPNDINAFIDKLLNNIRNDPNLHIDPLIVPNQKQDWNGISIELKDGKVYGLKSVHREGNMRLDCSSQTKCNIMGSLAINNIVGRFNTRLKMLFIVITPTLKITVDVIQVTFTIALDFKAPQGEAAKLLYFKISRFADPRIEIGDLGPFGPVLTWIARILVPTFRGQLVNSVEGLMRKAIEEQLKKVHF